ncbi:synaptonemal complex protein 1 [Scomber japonicus]|uniref:synaptonemal complex protein 1 n=1 Tax=Scomber japonicus TaxID=13676 RepID=UPI0023068D77|nr:synaptonemal complex protein 1 [Scomber japonicus]
MDRDRGFSFKLLVPPRVNNGQVSAVRPQEIGYSTCFDKEQNMPFPNTSVVAPTKPTRQDFPKMKAVPPMEKEEKNCNPGQLYSKLFDEVDKIKCWKVKADSDIVQRERKLQENKRTIETQRKAIQELQFGNESLSIKLEEQISENEDLTNRNNATRNLCNILKDTFQRSAEKIHLFESEREETHHILMDNSESIQKLIGAFESLRIQAEAHQQELLKVKEDLQQCEDLKDKYHQEYNIKEDEVVLLQTNLNDNVNELQKSLRDLRETQDQCKQLLEATNQQQELLKSSKAEQESLLQKLHTAEQRNIENETSQEALAAMLKQSKEEYAQIIESKDLSLQELIRVKDQQAKKLEEIQTTIQELQESLATEIQRVKECEDKLVANNEELERTNTLLGEAIEQSGKKSGQIKIFEDELDKASKSTEAMKGKMDILEARVEQLKAELSRKTEEAQLITVILIESEAQIAFAENDLLKKGCETAEKAHEDLKEKFDTTEIKVQELEGQLSSEIKKNEEYTYQMEQLKKDLSQHEVKYEELLSNFNELQSEKKAIEQQFESGSSNVKDIEANMKVSEEKATKLTREIQRLEKENKCLRMELNSIKTQIQGRYQETETLQKKIEENCEHFQEEITKKEKQIKAVETKLCNLRRKFETKLRAQEEYQKENKMLKKQLAKETVKSSQLENEISSLQEETENLKRLNEEERQKLLKDLESKSTFAVELENEVQKLRLTGAEAMKNKEDTELKCQHKIADMVTLMEKHKSQYDRMVEEKDAELDENKNKEIKAVAHTKSLELDVLKHKTENDQLKKQLMTEKREKEKLQNKLSDLKKEVSSMKINLLSEASKKQSSTFSHKQEQCSENPKESSSKKYMFDFCKTGKTPSYCKDAGSTAVMKKAESDTESIRTSCGTTPKSKEILNDLKTPRSITNRVGGTSKIKSYRIRTPPSDEKATCWGKSTFQLDPKSDSSDQTDLLTFVDTPASSFSAHSKRSMFRKSPVTHKSPGNSLKLAAMKRMRDAGWTAVTGCDKKKKTTNEKIFA